MRDSLLPAIVAVSTIVLIGLIASRTLKLEAQTLSQLTVYILAPALVADSLYRTTLSAQSMVGLLGGFLLISLLLYGIIQKFSQILNLAPDTYKSLLATTLLPNNGNLGLPLIDFALGAAGLERAIVYMIGSSILLFGVTPALLQGSSLIQGIRFTLKLPLIWAMLGGLSLHLLGIKLPLPLEESMRQLGQAAIPIALVILGMQLADTRLAVGKYELAAIASCLLLAPFIAYTVGKVLGLEGLDLQVLILQSAMPAAVNSLVLVAEFGGNAARVARTIAATTLMSCVTLPVALWAAAQF